MNWGEIIGHKDVLHTLQAMLSTGRIPHALLFSGPAGVGKRLVARLMATALLCEGNARPCGNCRSCNMASCSSHPDLTRISPDGATIKIDQIRALQHFAALAPVLSPARVCIIEDAELMTVQAANSLLKLLEEPPPGFVFILVAGASQPLLPTILSRCRIVAFQPLSAKLLTQSLVSQGYTPESAAVAARMSGGRMGAALGLLAPDGLAARDMAAEILAGISGNSMTELWNKVAEIDKLDSKQTVVVLNYLLYLMRDLLLTTGRCPDQLLYNIDLVSELKGWADDWTEKGILAALAAIIETIRALKGNANIKLAAEALLITLKDLAGKGD